MLHTSAATSRIMRIYTCFHKCAYITVTLHSNTPYTTYASAHVCTHVHSTITMHKHVMWKIKENTSQRKLAHRSITMIIALVIITVDTIMHNQVSIVINVIIISFQLSSSTEAAAAAKLSSQINLHPHRHRHKQHQSHHSFIITITTVTTITFKKHWWLRANANINAGKRIQPINVKQNRL